MEASNFAVVLAARPRTSCGEASRVGNFRDKRCVVDPESCLVSQLIAFDFIDSAIDYQGDDTGADGPCVKRKLNAIEFALPFLPIAFQRDPKVPATDADVVNHFEGVPRFRLRAAYT